MFGHRALRSDTLNISPVASRNFGRCVKGSADGTNNISVAKPLIVLRSILRDAILLDCSNSGSELSGRDQKVKHDTSPLVVTEIESILKPNTVNLITLPHVVPLDAHKRTRYLLKTEFK